MPRYLAAMDESGSGRDFVSGGFVAPVDVWDEHFSPAWDERVLAGPPRIPFLHMVDARDRDWCKEHGLSGWDMERRIDEAAAVIRSTGPLALISSTLNADHLRKQLGGTQLVMPTKQPGVYGMEPDYIGFLNFAHVTLIWVSQYQPDADRVDFVVERKQDISRRFKDFYKDLKAHLEELDLPEVARLVGELRDGAKEEPPLQAADFALWHMQRIGAGRAERADHRRFGKIRDGRLGYWHRVEDESVSELAAESVHNTVEDPRKRQRVKANVPIDSGNPFPPPGERLVK